MENVQDILKAINNVRVDDINAKSKLFLYWQRLFLLEKDMTVLKKRELMFSLKNDLMNKRVYMWDLKTSGEQIGEIEKLLKEVIDIVYERLYRRGFINYITLNPCCDLCKDASIMLYETFKKFGIGAKIIHTNNLGMKLVPHFFVVVTIGDKKYIVDITFRQFLVVPYFIPEIIYHFKNNFLSPAYFGNDEFFINLGENGFFEASMENLAIYLSGFANACNSTFAKDVSDLEIIRAKKIKIKDYIDRFDFSCDHFNIERYAPHLAS